MADETTTETVDETTDETTTEDTKVEEKPEDKTEEAGEKKPEEGDDLKGPDGEDVPDWVRKSLSKANTEAANYRTQLRDLQAKLEGAKTPEEVAAVTKELSDKNTQLAHEVAVERALRVHELEDGDKVFFEGKTPEQIEAIAKRLKEKAGSSGTDPRRLKGGLVPDEGDPTPDNPRELARLTRR